MTKQELKSEKDYLATDCDKAGEIAIQYGFTVVRPPHITSHDISLAKQFKEFDTFSDAEEKVTLTNWYLSSLQNQSQPVMIHYKKPLAGSSHKKKSSEEIYGLEIMGSGKAESEALMLKTTLAILSDFEYTDVCVDINSIGDRESVSRFEREINAYYRKVSHTLSAKVKDLFKKNYYALFSDTTSPDTHDFRDNAPNTVGSLSEASRLHFKEVLEYMEAFGVMYKIKPHLFSNKLYATQTVFEIRDCSHIQKKDGEGALLAYGYRYNYLAKKIGNKKDVSSVGMTITVKKNKIPAKKLIVKNIKKPRFYLVQLGGTAKLKALNVIEMLRLERIPVYHSLTKDKITGQLSGAEYMRATHVLIIGQKEAIEESIVVRHLVTREQETVLLCELAEFLKKL